MTVLVVTGTGTGVGKTVVTAALAALAPGKVAVVKAAQTGVGVSEDGDLAEVARLSGCVDLHEFARYPDPLSPEAAARVSGLPELRYDDVLQRVDALDQSHDLVIVEGAGGLLVRFDSDGWTIADLAGDLDARLVVVTAAGLGTLNHTTLTLEAIQDRVLELAGLVIGAWPAEPGLAERCNVIDLRALNRRRFAGAIPAGIGVGPTTVKDFTDTVREWLAPELGGTFDGTAFAREVASTIRTERA